MPIHDQRQKKSLHKTVRFAWTALLLFAGNGYVAEYYLNRITPEIDGALRVWLEKWDAHANTFLALAACLLVIDITLSLYQDRKLKRQLELGELPEDEVEKLT